MLRRKSDTSQTIRFLLLFCLFLLFFYVFSTSNIDTKSRHKVTILPESQHCVQIMYHQKRTLSNQNRKKNAFFCNFSVLKGLNHLFNTIFRVFIGPTILCADRRQGKEDLPTIFRQASALLKKRTAPFAKDNHGWTGLTARVFPCPVY